MLLILVWFVLFFGLAKILFRSPLTTPAWVQTFWNPSCHFMSKISQNGSKCVNHCQRVHDRMWTSVLKSLKVSLMSFPAQIQICRHSICWKWKKMLKMAKSVWRMFVGCVRVWRWLWKCWKVSPMNFPVQAHTSGHLTYWNRPKMVKIAQKYVKVCEECMGECKGECESLTHEFSSSST